MKKVSATPISSLRVNLYRFAALAFIAMLFGCLLPPNPAAGESTETGVTESQAGLSEPRDEPPPYAPWVHLAELTESPGEGVSFGDILAISPDGNTIVAGVPLRDFSSGNHIEDGLVRVYTKPEGAEWEDAHEAPTLTASDGYDRDRFGITVAISDDLIVVGKQCGSSVYVFVKPGGGWQDMTETARLGFILSGLIACQGESIAIMGDSILSGFSYWDEDFPEGKPPGAVFVWNKPAGGWADTDAIGAMLTLSEGHATRLGVAMSASGNTLVVGGFAGAYIFERPPGGWADMTETAKLSPSSMGVGFGVSVAIDGDTAVVGSSSSEGSVFLYEKPAQGWTDMTETAKLTAADGTLPNGRGIRLGHSVAISGKQVAVGAKESYAAYVFEKPENGWVSATETAHFPPDTATDRSYKPSVAIRDNVLVTGYPYKLDVYKKPTHRPVMVVPGIFGSYFFADATHEQWNLHRGVHPDLLLIDPLTHAYDDLVQTLKNAGYEEGKDLFVVAYDWRLTPGPVDGVYDGRIGGLSGRSITDGVYQYGVDYLGYYLRKAAEAWDEEHPDEPLENVDIISHSTGGLVARSYIQSAAYGDDFVASGGKTLTLPIVENLIMVAVPNRGASQPWQAMNNNFIIDFASKYIMSKMLNASYQKVLAGETITGFPEPITLASISLHGAPLGTEFISQYAPTFRSLLATYDFMYDSHGELGNVNDLADVRNDLVLDLNNGLDNPNQSPPSDPSPFASLVAETHVFYADSVATEYRVRYRDDAEWNVIFHFDDYFESDVPAGLVWYLGVTDNVGDETVPGESSMGQFIGDNRIQRYRITGGNNTHTGLMSHLHVQLEILDILDADWEDADISTGLANTAYVSALWNAYIDPVDMVIVDGSGRRFGYTAATGPITEIPNSIWFGGDEGMGWILGPVTPPLSVELTGLGESYLVHLAGAQADMRGGYGDSGFLDAGEQISAQVGVAARRNFLPIVANTSTPSQQTVTLTSVSDATVLEGYPASNFGDASDMWAGYDDMLDPNGKIARGLIKFDLSSLPNGATIQNATLRIYYMGHWEFPNWVDTITAYQAQGAWQEMSVTWNNKPGFGDSYGNVDVVADGNWGWRELDVTHLVQSWMNGSFANDGVMLRGEEASGAESSRRSFYTREGDYPPELVVTYSGAANMHPTRPVAPEASETQSVSIMQRLNASRFGDDSGREHQVIE